MLKNHVLSDFLSYFVFFFPATSLNLGLSSIYDGTNGIWE